MKIQLPSWLRRDSLALPPWAHRAKKQSAWASITIEADTDPAMSEWFTLLASPGTDADSSKWLSSLGPVKKDQYWIEVAYQCAKLDLQMALVGTEYDPRVAGKPAEFKFSRANDWALTLHPHGRGIEAAAQGREARRHYVRIRGRMPF